MKTENKNRTTGLMAAILAVVMLFGVIAAPVQVSATQDDRSSSEIKEDLEKLEEKQKELLEEIAGIEGQMSDNMEDMQDAVDKKNLIDQETFLLMEQVTNINAQIAAYNALIADKQQEVEQAQQELAEMQERNKYRLRAMEKNSYTSYWSVVFQADSFLDMLDRIKMIQEIQAADRKMINEIHEAADVVNQAKEALETEKLGLEESKKELDKTQEELEAKREEADAILAELVAKGDEYAELIEKAEAQKAELGDQIDAAQNAYDEAKEREAYESWLEQQEQQQANNAQQQNPQQGTTGGTGGTANETTSGTWLVPVNYVYMSSPFGYRWHPVYGTYTFHYGVDLAAAQGTPIVATRSGTVSVATYDSAAGYYVNINHGDGFVSRYLHLTHYIVSPGQYVEAGQVIGYCGSTGASTGPHLHFGIYYNGTAVNPANYIAI